MSTVRISRRITACPNTAVQMCLHASATDRLVYFLIQKQQKDVFIKDKNVKDCYESDKQSYHIIHRMCINGAQSIFFSGSMP